MEGSFNAEASCIQEAAIAGWIFAEQAAGSSNSGATFRHKQDRCFRFPRSSASFDRHISEMQRSDTYQEIRQAIDEMNEMISSLLECSKGRDTLRPAARNIIDTVERAIQITSVRQQFPRISIKHHHEGLAVGWFDSNRLERVVANLVLNACEAVSPHSGQVVITTTGNRDCLQMGVWDNGPGIPATIQDSVFQPFVSYGKAEGSGLGLAIAKKIVEDHGGEIYLDGRSETGTLFKITIPFGIPEGAISFSFHNSTTTTPYAV
jgi:signal transduction histidine kinase